MNVEAVDAFDESDPSISTINEIIARHGVSLADAIKADVDLTRFRADVARRIADEEAAFHAEIARLAADKRQATNL